MGASRLRVNCDCAYQGMNKPGNKILYWAARKQRAKKEQLILRKKPVYEDVSKYTKKLFINLKFASPCIIIQFQ